MSESKSDKKVAKGASVDEFDKDIITKNPNLEIAQLRFLVNNKELDPAVKNEKLKVLQTYILDNEMGPFYELLTAELGAPLDKALLAELKAKNAKRIAEIDAEIADAEQNLGESEVRQALLKKSEYLCQIGDKDAAVSAFRHTYEKTVGIGYRIDLVFNLIRLGLFFLDHKLINANISKAKDLMEQGGDWDRKNRLRSYEGLYKMSTRDFKGAAALFLEAVPTFGSYELMSYEDLVFYTVLTTVYSLDRPELREKVIRCNEVQEQLTGGGEKGDLIPIRQYLDSFYNCHYDQFFVGLAQLEAQRLKFDRYVAPHYGFYSRAMRLKAYEQFLTPYKTVRLDMMSKDFGVSKAFIDRELHRLISTGQLNCRIDAVRGVIEMNHPDNKNHLYKTVMRDGDVLLNRIQKLARVVNA
uniref:26S proteasome non-ATPase regulatory subunit 6 n=1 Tax=Panagrellus redivivus TaxID=6233 RepID=A0A7E4W0E6_PANRE